MATSCLVAVSACSSAGGTPKSDEAATGGTAALGGSVAAGGTDVVVGSGGTGGEVATGGSMSGGTSAGGGSGVTGGSGTGGIPSAGGVTSTGGAPPTGGVGGTGGSATGGLLTGGTDTGGFAGTLPTGGTVGGGDGGTAGSGDGGSSGSGGVVTGDCTPSEAVATNASGTGPYEVVVETNSDPGINEGTIYRPADLGGAEKFPIFVWGEGACEQNGLSNATAMAEIASYGYFVVADGTPSGSGNRTMDRSDMVAMGAPLIAYVDWAIDENEKPCSVYHQSLDTTMIAANGFSCGGLMAQGTVTDPRIVTWGVTSSGMAGATQAFYDPIHTPVLFVEGGPSDMAYDGGLEGYETISALGVPVLWFSRDIGHGGDLFQAGGGDFTRINLAWLNWWLKGDETVTGKGLLVGSGCSYCSDNAWEVLSANVP